MVGFQGSLPVCYLHCEDIEHSTDGLEKLFSVTMFQSSVKTCCITKAYKTDTMWALLSSSASNLGWYQAHEHFSLRTGPGETFS